MHNKKKDWKILWELFKSTFILSASTFGGGFVIVSLMKKKFVEELGWLEEDEMLEEENEEMFEDELDAEDEFFDGEDEL